MNFNPPTSICPATNYAYTVQAQDYDGNPITFSLVNAPAGMAIGSTSGLITWTPTASQATSTPYTVTVRITDGQTGPVSISYQLTVPTTGCGGGGGGGGGTSTPPILGTSTQNLPPYFIGTSPALRACTGVLANYDVDAVDPDGDRLTFSLVAGPVGMAIAQRTGDLFWVPTAAQTRTTYPVTVAVTDGTYSVTRTIFATGVACGTPAPKPPVIPPAVQGTSTVAVATSTCSTSTEAATGGTSLAMLLASIGDWFSGILGLLLWILTLIAFIVYAYLNEREKRRMQGTIERFAGNGLPAGMATRPGSIHDEVILDDILVDDIPQPDRSS